MLVKSFEQSTNPTQAGKINQFGIIFKQKLHYKKINESQKTPDSKEQLIRE